MNKLTAASPEAQSADLVAGNIDQLKALFPDLITEGPNGKAVNVDVLKALVGDQTVTDADEKYGLNWHGKRRARQLALTPSTGTLRPCRDESVDWDTTQNLMIEGDNLEVLKLLQKSYAGKVKLIYIDPPYNTGKDFVYPDNFQDNIKNYLELTGQVEGGQKISSNTEASGRFHTDWLNMMYPRLKVAKAMLHPAGAVMVSCDDNELSRLLIVMDELFGEENFVAQVIWQRSKKGDAKLIAAVHEYIVCYVRDKSAVLEQTLSLGVGMATSRCHCPKRTSHSFAKLLSQLSEHLWNLENEQPRPTRHRSPAACRFERA
ncbi:site-specific DNA-methyltransferase [Stutzerimonas kunmingensis]|uniref:site-specific DNA-methyltransferase n=1 Tax=Stutzerimonas kunmingensis TaxID=1211807 RepID=UPI003AB87BEE